MVFVLDKHQKPLMPCSEKRARLLLERGRARIHKMYLACHACNQEKGPRTAEEFGYPDIPIQARHPLKDAAMMNATRWRLYDQLKATELSVEGRSGARTKMQRIQHNLPKEHYYDA
ncbi:RRXRR domain-containing protein [Sulfobacillus thermosulfidooxidans]|uniref:RRXRR domain-containing protein n=1 Tax=Sulfobacillus thermosulfidooxidans TaxID=28034 RepID=UPI0006B4F7BB|nr:RRXRR domain-containing protein [Sulfobacillus thermosulfidooxidans]